MNVLAVVLAGWLVATMMQCRVCQTVTSRSPPSHQHQNLLWISLPPLLSSSLNTCRGRKRQILQNIKIAGCKVTLRSLLTSGGGGVWCNLQNTRNDFYHQDPPHSTILTTSSHLSPLSSLIKFRKQLTDLAMILESLSIGLDSYYCTIVGFPTE